MYTLIVDTLERKVSDYHVTHLNIPTCIVLSPNMNENMILIQVHINNIEEINHYAVLS